MPPKDMFVIDPREIPFLKNEVQKLLVLADNSFRNVRVKDDDDFGFMVMPFLYKQMQHAESVLNLVPRRDTGLIARTMIEGLYQILWAYQVPDKRAKLWRSFSIIHDWRLIQSRVREGLPVEDEDIRKNEAGLKEFGDLHKMKKPNVNSLDPYYKSWRGGVSLSDLANAVGRQIYEGPYSDLSDWAHWGLSGIGESIIRDGDRITIESTSERVSCLSLVTAFQCLFQTLEVANRHLSLQIEDTLQHTEQAYIAMMDVIRSPGKKGI